MSEVENAIEYRNLCCAVVHDAVHHATYTVDPEKTNAKHRAKAKREALQWLGSKRAQFWFDTLAIDQPRALRAMGWVREVHALLQLPEDIVYVSIAQREFFQEGLNSLQH